MTELPRHAVSVTGIVFREDGAGLHHVVRVHDGTTTAHGCCDNFLYGFKGAPSARRA